MAPSTLTLFRRHTKSCSKSYEPKSRSHFPVTARQRSKDCDCPISADGLLKIEGRIINRSTHAHSWDAAEAVVEQWQAWGQTTAPAPTPAKVVPTIEYAVCSFLASIGPTGRNVEENTIATYEVLLQKRLLPYATSKCLSMIEEFDRLDVATKFVESWCNLQPTRNRIDVEIPSTPVALADSTKKTELERFRAFLRYCKDRGWMQQDHSKKLTHKAKIEGKFGLLPDEEERLFAAVERFHLRSNAGGASEYESRELLAFCYVMRYAGLRMVDATTLDDQQLVRRASGEGYALKVYQQKAQSWVYVPVPPFVAAALQALTIKGEANGKRYYFWSGNGQIETAENNWYTKIMKVVKLVVNERPFQHAFTPHCFRHTFSIAHLNAGTDIKWVSRWLGHASTQVTETHYGHANHGTLVASDAAYDASINRQRL